MFPKISKFLVAQKIQTKLNYKNIIYCNPKVLYSLPLPKGTKILSA